MTARRRLAVVPRSVPRSGAITADPVVQRCPTILHDSAPMYICDDDGGLGDVLYGSRFLTPLLRRRSRITFEVDKPLVNLLAYSFPAIDVLPRSVSRLRIDPFPLSELQSALGIEDADAPAPPYLRADPDRIAHYSKLIPADAVGLCWSASNWSGVEKAMPLDYMSPLYRRFPLCGPAGRRGARRDDRHACARPPLLPDGASFGQPDFAEAAALVSALRCVVTVDTCAMHLAGGLGVEAHLALLPQWAMTRVQPWAPARWVHRRMRSTPGSPEIWDGPWAPGYPTVHGYIGDHVVDWGRGVIARIAAALAA